MTTRELKPVPEAHVAVLKSLTEHFTTERDFLWEPHGRLFYIPNPNDPENGLCVSYIKDDRPFSFMEPKNGGSLYTLCMFDDDENEKIVARLYLPNIV